MIPILYPAHEADFSTQGLGRLADAVECIVTEERNGVYELEMTFPLTGKRYADIDVGAIIGARHDDAGDIQPFRIYKITRPISGLVRIYARHISYDLAKIVVLPYSADTITEALDGIAEHAVHKCPFTFWTDKYVESPFSVTVPSSIRSILGGMEGSILDVYGGEYEFDGYQVKLHLTRGVDSNVTIRYGKNLTDLTADADGDNAVTAVIGYWRGADADGNETVVQTPYVLNADLGTTEAYVNEDGVQYTNEDGVVYDGLYNPMWTEALDLSEQFETQPSKAQLIAATQQWLDAHATLVPSDSITISFVALWQTNEYAEYAPLQRVNLCDTVTLVYPALGITQTMEVVKVVYNVLLERYDSMEVGKPRNTLAQTIAETATDITNLKTNTPTITWMDAAVAAVRNVGTLQSEDGTLTVNLTDASIRSTGTANVSTRVNDADVTYDVETMAEVADGSVQKYGDYQQVAVLGMAAEGMDDEHAAAADAWQDTSYPCGDVEVRGESVMAYADKVSGDTDDVGKMVTYKPLGSMTPDKVRVGMADSMTAASGAILDGDEVPDRNVAQLAGGWNTVDDAVTYEEFYSIEYDEGASDYVKTFRQTPIIHRGAWAYAPEDTVEASQAYLHGVLIGTDIHLFIPLSRPVAKEVTAAAIDMGTTVTIYQASQLASGTLTALGVTAALTITDIGIDLTLTRSSWGGSNNTDCTVCLTGMTITFT